MKRALAFLLSLMMVFSLLPASALATETPVSEAAAIEAPAEQSVAEELELLDNSASTAPYVYSGTPDGQVRFYYSSPLIDTTRVLDVETELYFCKEENGQYRRVADDTASKSNWGSQDPYWAISGILFAEHGEGWYYAAVRCKYADESEETFGEWGTSEPLYFAYSEDAVQLEAPLNVHADAGFLTYELPADSDSDYVLLAVIWQDGEEGMDILDYRKVQKSLYDAVALDDDLLRNMADGIYNISLIGCSDSYPVNYLPSEWITATYKLGSNPETDPDYPQDNPDAVARYTRIQVAALLVDALEWEYDADQMGHITFSDVTDPMDAQTAAIVAYHQAMNGTGANTFNPDSYVTRAQLAQSLFRALDLPAGTFIPGDVESDAWYVEAVSAVVEADLMFTDAYGNFRPNETATTDDVDPSRIWELANPSTESGTRGKCGDNLQWELDLSTYVLTITGSGEMYDYNDAPWSAWSEQITAVSLPEGLTHLGGSALYTCGQITELTLPSTLESIGNRAIASCWFLESLHIPAKVTDIGANALGFDVSLTEITVDPANTAFRAENGFLLTTDGKTLVALPGGLTGTVTLPAGITALGTHAFCGSLAEQVVLPASLTTIENRAFFGCNHLESIELPAGVTQIDEEAFYKCKDLHTVTFLGNAPTLGENVFGGCASDFCIYYDPAATGWTTPTWNGWPACPIGGTPALPEAPAATDLQWDVGITASGENTAKGWFSFYGTNGVAYEIKVYYRSAADADWTQVYSKAVTPVKGYFNQIPFNYHPERCQTGDYYFTVQALGNGTTYVDGPIQTSAVWSYTRPTAQLVPTDLCWSVDKSMNWNLDETYVLEYHVGVLFNGTEDNLNGARMVDEDWYGTTETPVLSEELLAKYGTGWYYFALQPITYDPTVTLTPTDIFYSNGYYHSASAALPEAPAAYDLQWHTWRNNSGSVSEYQLGAISFGRTDTGMEQEFRVDFYRKEASGDDTHIGELWTYLREDRPYRTLYPFEELDDVFTTGTYYFTVTAMGDGSTTCDGQPVRSGEWAYTRPEVKLSVSNAYWGTDMSLNWTDAAQNDSYLDCYMLQYQFVGQGDTFREDNWDYSTSYYPDSSDHFPYPPADRLNSWGDGKYYFRIRAISDDVNEAVCSDWSDWSEAYTYTRPSDTLTVSDLKWEGNTLSWTPDFGKDAPLAGYQIYIYEKSSYAVSKPDAWWDWDSVPADATSYTMPKWMVENLPDRTWHFAVTTISANPAAYNSNYGSAPTTAWTYTPPANKLATPTNLRWHVDFEWDWDEVNDKQLFIPFTRYGSMAFDVGTPTQDHYEVELWQVQASGDVCIHDTTWGFGSTDERTSLSVPDFIYYVTESGTYYFKIRACSDDMNYADSDWAISPTWTYTAPSAQLKAPTGLYWDDYSIDYDGVKQIAQFWQTDPEAGYYEVEHFFSPTETGTPEGGNSNFDMHNGEGVHNTLHDHIIEDRGEGWYYFRVRAISPDITRIRNSAWSAMSPAYNLSLVVDNANQKLDDILGDTSDDNYTAPSAVQIQQAVEEIEHLDKAMAADAADGSTGTLEKLAELEQLVMDELNIVPETNVDADVFTPALADKITVSNMALNVDIDEVDREAETAVTLTISGAGADKPDTPEALNPAQYSNTLMFKMDIPEAKDNDDNDTNGKQLKIPVQITLPIPADINPNFLVILHHKSDGTWEELRMPHIFKDGGQWYATFNVHEFSYYALSQRAPSARAEGNTVTVEAHLPTNGVKTQYLCGVYSEAGQMLGMGILQPQAENPLTITLDKPVPDGAYVKIFAPDAGAGWTVHSQAIEVEIK